MPRKRYVTNLIPAVPRDDEVDRLSAGRGRVAFVEMNSERDGGAGVATWYGRRGNGDQVTARTTATSGRARE